MQAKNYLESTLQAIVAEQGFTWPAKVIIEPPKNLEHGDLAINLAMLLAPQAKLKPRQLAEDLGKQLKARCPQIAKLEVAGPGFLNLTFSPEFWHELVLQVLEKNTSYGSSQEFAQKRVQIEYVSANPTGPLHIGHGRGAAVGDALARILRYCGYEVSTEYYINDAGRQMRLLGLSIWLWVQNLSNVEVTWPEEYYRGSYIKDIAQELLTQNPKLATKDPIEAEDFCFQYGMKSILDGIKQDLAAFQVEHLVWFSESSLFAEGRVEATFNQLKEMGLAYTEGGALWFKSTQFGDDKDRVLIKSDGSLTYFASDIAYHAHKYERGFDLLVDIWGADHHGYIPRMKAAIKALGRQPNDLQVVLIQLVNLLVKGQQVAMSTRAGKFETLNDVVAEVGVDAARFMFLSRKSDSHLDFDLELVKERTLDNPVYYVQYAHARVSSVVRRAADLGLSLPCDFNLSHLQSLQSEDDLSLIRLLDTFPDIVLGAGRHLSAHHISHYLMDLAGNLHSYYAKNSVLQAGDPSLVIARLALLQAVAQVLRNGLNLLGVSSPENM